jgi:hypothetical protein
VIRLVALDPGETTGVAWWEEGWWKPVVAQPPWLTAVRQVHDALARGVLTTVVMEAYVITASTLRKSRVTAPLDVIGAVRYLCELYQVPLEMQTAAEAKSFVSNDRLRAAGWYEKGLDHGRDATRHLLLYLVRERLVPIRAVRVVD